MTAKYKTGDSDATQWNSDRRHVLSTWTTQPYLDIRNRHDTVEQRLVVEYTHDVGVDIRHEARSDETDKIDDDWQLIQAIEVRDYGARYDRRPEARWFDD